jgi:DNA invertase Pin-like site-specific DNA recombinase
MIARVEAGEVANLLVKDLSRADRNYLETGFYTEVFFREKGVRFIAIANNIDSINSDSAEFAPFLNIMSEWYLRDASRKVKAVFKSRGMSGKRLTFSPIYGYKRDPNDKDKWVIDDGGSADVVRRIFQMTIDGKGPVQIARILAEEKVERPTYYLTTRGIVDYGYFDMSDPYRWAGGSVAHIIERPEYRGDTVNFRSYKESYKDKKVKFAAPEDWVIFEDTHPGIVSRETWETAQKCRKTIRRTDTLGEANPLTGLVFCANLI